MKVKKFLLGLLGVLFVCVLMLGLKPTKAFADATLATPTNVRIDGLKVKWDSVPEAENYRFTLYLYQASSASPWYCYLDTYVSSSEVDLTKCIYNGEWKVEVIACGGGRHSGTAVLESEIITGAPRERLQFENVRVEGNWSRQRLVWDYPSYYLNSIRVEFKLYRNSVSPANFVTSYGMLGPYYFDCYELMLTPGEKYWLELTAAPYMESKIIGPFYMLSGKTTIGIEGGAPAKANKKLIANFTPEVAGIEPSNGVFEWQVSRTENGTYRTITDANGNAVRGKEFIPERYNGY